MCAVLVLPHCIEHSAHIRAVEFPPYNRAAAPILFSLAPPPAGATMLLSRRFTSPKLRDDSSLISIIKVRALLPCAPLISVFLL